MKEKIISYLQHNHTVDKGSFILVKHMNELKQYLRNKTSIEIEKAIQELFLTCAEIQFDVVFDRGFNFVITKMTYNSFLPEELEEESIKMNLPFSSALYIYNQYHTFNFNQIKEMMKLYKNAKHFSSQVLYSIPLSQLNGNGDILLSGYAYKYKDLVHWKILKDKVSEEYYKIFKSDLYKAKPIEVEKIHYLNSDIEQVKEHIASINKILDINSNDNKVDILIEKIDNLLIEHNSLEDWDKLRKWNNLLESWNKLKEETINNDNKS